MSNAVETKGQESLLGAWLRFANSTIGSKMLMAVTGAGLFLFIVAHMAGNLTVFAGAETFNHYAEVLQGNPLLLWGERIALIIAFPLHIIMAVRCAEMNQSARPQPYAYPNKVEATLGAKTMLISGGIIATFFLYHLAHFTLRIVGPQPDPYSPYSMLVMGFQNPLISLLYVAGQLLLATHLSHGIFSMFQHLGMAGKKWTPFIKLAAQIAGYGVCAAFAAIPVAVLVGVIKP